MHWGVRRTPEQLGHDPQHTKNNSGKEKRERVRKAAKFTKDFTVSMVVSHAMSAMTGIPVVGLPKKNTTAGQKAAVAALNILFAVSVAKLGHTLYKSQYDPDTWVKWESPFGNTVNISDYLRRRRSRVKPLALNGGRVVKTIH